MEERPGDDRQQLPPPSLWPVGFAVGIVCLLVGLIVSWPVAAVGAGLALVFGFLWAREVATGRAPTVAPEGEEAAVDGRPAPAVPAHEGEAAMPEPEPGERFPRSKFLEGATLGLGAIIGAIVTLPAVALALVPGFVKQKAHEVDLGPVGDFEENKWKVVTFLRDPSEGDVSNRTAFVRNNGLLDGTPSFTIISNRCAHLGCPVQAGGPLFVKQEKTVKTANGDVRIIPALPAAGFICPCHGGSYDQEGNRIAGPPVRALDRYEFSIVDGRLILGDLYSVANVQGTGKDAKIKKQELTGPGQHVDGPESWLYPVQAPH
ncbi:MAG TPA: Rieske 2Fe-2S domain-containing protein [Gaiellaceae bacterium]|nr:Rieske 2Fe-2S domain-containing protein [Gaiellaceae bacterium]